MEPWNANVQLYLLQLHGVTVEQGRGKREEACVTLSEEGLSFVIILECEMRKQ